MTLKIYYSSKGMMNLILVIIIVCILSFECSIVHANDAKDINAQERITKLKEEAYKELSEALEDNKVENDKRQISVLVDINHNEDDTDEPQMPYLATFDVTELNPWVSKIANTIERIFVMQSDPSTGEVTTPKRKQDSEDLPDSIPHDHIPEDKSSSTIERKQTEEEDLPHDQKSSSPLESNVLNLEKARELQKQVQQTMQETKQISEQIGFTDRGCVSWRQTGSCDPYNGPRESQFDLSCETIVASGFSGYCECANGVELAHSDCSHQVFTCSERCARPAPEDMEVAKEEYPDKNVDDINNALAKSTLFVNFTKYNVHEFAHAKRLPFYFIILCNCQRDALVSSMITDIDEALSKYKGKFSFLYLSPATIKDFSLSSIYLLNGVSTPTAFIDNLPMGTSVEKFIFNPSNEFTVSNLLSFARDFYSNNLPLIVRSQSPEEPLPNPLSGTGKIIKTVAIRFKDVVLSDYTVLLMVYSPSCGGSRAIMPVIEQVALSFKDDNRFVIARFDHTNNDFPIRGLAISHYPVCFLFPKGSKDRHLNYDDYNGSKIPHNTSVPHSHYEVESIKQFMIGRHPS